jgi:hypothetical protein
MTPVHRTTPRPRVLRGCALLAATALTLSACGGGGDDDTGAGGATPTETVSVPPTPTTNVDVPRRVTLTPPGTQLDFGETASVAHELKRKGTVLDVTVDSAVQGSLEDFAGFDLDDPYKRRGNYYYVRVSIRNSGKDTLGGIPVPLWGISGDNTLLQAVEFKSSFKRCPTQPLPADFGPRDTFKTCLVYLSPDRGELEGVSYRPYEEFVPIEWRGNVKMLPKAKKKQRAES